MLNLYKKYEEHKVLQLNVKFYFKKTATADVELYVDDFSNG